MFRKYNKLLLSGGAVATVVMFAYAMVYGHLSANFWIFRCDASLYSSEYYLSYCADPAYGSYESGAIYLGVDKESIKNLKAAEILILGNSRSQLGFSGKVIKAFSKGRGINFFNLAFNGEFDVFPKKIIEKYNLHPRIIIINADYFFYNSANIYSKKAISKTQLAEFEYGLKAWVQPLHKKICGDGGYILSRLICGNEPTQYRSRIDGSVISPNWPNEKVPISYSDKFPKKDFPQLLENARKFKKFADDRNAQLVITVVPSKFATPMVGKKIAEDLKIPFILPEAKGLTGYDAGHLNAASAEIWTKAFFKKFKPLVLTQGRF